ncbi:MAG: FemAB family PEP-CTERM system-associated protein [Planctomycetes bacterium]|nr:FemAB family PEP-CTERM system-associated protein [Planctomycetota bacterium]
MSNRDIQITSLESIGDDAWNAYASSRPDATLFHGLAWKAAVQESFGHRPWYLVALRDGAVVGVLPLFEIQSLFAGRFLLSVPYATYGGPLSDDPAVSSALIEHTRTIAIRVRASCVELRSMEPSIENLPLRESHAAFIRTLPSNADDVLAMIPRKARAAARRCEERNTVSFETGHELVADVWDLYSRSMRRLGSPNYPLRFFTSLLERLGDNAAAQVVRHEGRPVAGLLSFVHRKTAMPYFVGVDERADLYGLTNYLYWQNMRFAVQRGCDTYDFGRTRIDNTGPFEFKRSFGFEPRLLGYQTLVMPGHRAPDLAPGSPKWAAARRAWTHLPLPVTRPLGAWLSKSIPG